MSIAAAQALYGIGQHEGKAIFFRGVDRLEREGIPPKHLMAHMLLGDDPAGTTERMFHRFGRMVEGKRLTYRQTAGKAA